ncbi:protein of unknown function [Chryseolinea serpens]|uniref:DUF4331 domain-containing protein n=1 Tax=Chryseolinea serpens TaxID=947013 RepID=A0A1M5LYJ7_9BACT|nr:DUF4331 family protein [Chryseolinea serpens]SHG70091.1 protein of unknown function [Chryseolinea serpens]
MKAKTTDLRKGLAVLLAIGVISSATYLIAADHIDAPAVTGKASDITDFYAFESPSNSSNLVFVVNTQGLLAPTATAAAAFDSDVMLEVNIDNSSNKDNMEDLVLQVTFENGKVQVYGPVAPIEKGLNSTLVTTGYKVESDISTYAGSPMTGEANGIKVFAGPRDDPFFFDLDQYKKVIAGTATGFNNPGTDTFAGTNVMSVVIELPKSLLGSGPINAWATTNRKN